ncbi:MAG: hypothetical protein H0U79_06755, partial [Solirubrobacterales bacterium]|nr:hypothetical protein [Solirubrobacterales bacterium]
MTHRIIAAIAALALLAPAAALASRPDRPSANRPDRPDRPSANRPDRPGAGTGQAIRRTFIFRGTVSATDAAAGTVVLRVRHGNRAARRFVGLDVPFALAGAR